MAADVLLYQATHVPVGDDQVQHLELTRDIAAHFNKTYKQRVFRTPAIILTESKRIMSLRDPAKKMSKSDPHEQSRITLADSDEQIKAKIQRAPTDSLGTVSFDPVLRPGVSNLVAIYAALRSTSPLDAAGEMRGLNSSQLKALVTEATVATIAPIRDETSRLLQDPAHIEAVLQAGEETARAVAAENWARISQSIGI
ncbi:Tryptophan--tRNA ligase, mitochondrial [Coemansia spiralis]|nr:Tryptophan--tRNA ligase, mitochondrial [Coemansia spiralis]